MAHTLPRWIRDEIEWPVPIAVGARGMKVQRLQEWLTLHGLYLRVDGAFGPATEHAVGRFQSDRNLSVSGIVNEETASALTHPMWAVLEPARTAGTTFGDTVVELAELHLEHHPREVGGQNRGPWVRLYMRGNDGAPWAWCAGFVSFLLDQACEIANLDAPIAGSFSCDALAIDAQHRGVFAPGDDLSGSNTEARPVPGSLFLNRRTANDWTHVGLVVEAFDEHFISIEGNTNDDGYREGYEVCRRIRGYRSKDFIVFDAGLE
jgi:hypothetical protein